MEKLELCNEIDNHKRNHEVAETSSSCHNDTKGSMVVLVILG